MYLGSKHGMYLLFSMIVLIAIGIIMIYSASAIYAYQYVRDAEFFLKKQLMYCLLGTICCVGAYFLKPTFFERNSRLIVIFSVFMLILTYVPFLSREASGARRWLHIFGFNFQPAEFSKIALVVYCADYLKRKSKQIKKGSITVFMSPIMVFGLMSGLIVLQPDLGSVILLAFVASVMFFVAGLRYRYIVLLAVVCLIGFYFAVVQVPYRLERVTAFLNPWKDPMGSGFQIIQSFISFGLGGFKGVGLGASTQKLFYLPQSYTDFIYAIIAEELGLVGTVLVLVMFVFFFTQGVIISMRQTDIFKRMTAFTLCLLIAFQAILNIYVSTGLIPTKGLPLPFISFGGSSLIINMLAVGIILSIDRHKDT